MILQEIFILTSTAYLIAIGIVYITTSNTQSLDFKLDSGVILTALVLVNLIAVITSIAPIMRITRLEAKNLIGGTE